MASQDVQYSALAQLLDKRLSDWDQARKPQELKLLDCYQDVMRIPRDNDTKGSGAAKAKKTAGLFMGSTRNKVRSARAKINDALFGNGKLPFDTSPVNEEFKIFADTMEDILTEQLEKMKFRTMLKQGVNVLAKYGTGFVFGPFVRRETLNDVTVEVVQTDSGGFPLMRETEYEYDSPYFELGNTLDVYPDPDAREIKDGLGCFWASMESPHKIASWRDKDGYVNIDQALQGPGDRGNETGSDQAQQMRANIDYWRRNERIKVARFFGKIPAHMMPADSSEQMDGESELAPPVSGEPEQEDTGEMVDAIVIMAGGVVVKVDPMPWSCHCGTMRAVYEDEEEEVWGVGVAENNMPHQKIINAAVRLFMEGKGMALLGTKSVDRSKFLPTEDFRKFPGKVYQFKPGLTADERKNALIDHVEPDITQGWLSVVQLSEQMSDDDTAITKYTQGDDASNLNKTASGISMIMSASSLPLKEVIQNIDTCWIEPIIECLIDWNLKYLEVETVQRIHGDKAAETWQIIKNFGKSSFMEWKATGTASFMQKEVLTNKLRAFAQFALSNPQTAAVIDVRELVEQMWDYMEIGRESPVLKDEDGQNIPPQVKAQMQQLQQQVQQMGQALQNAANQVDKLEARNELDLAKARMQNEINGYKAETERLKLVVSLLPPQIQTALALNVADQSVASPDVAPPMPMQPQMQMEAPEPMEQPEGIEHQAPYGEPPDEQPDPTTQQIDQPQPGA